MENENTENLDSQNEEENENSENNESQEDLGALKKEKEELSDKNRQLFERAKRSESEVKELRDQIKKLSGNKEEEMKPESQSNEPDYGRLAFLQSKGIDNADDIKIIQTESERLKLPLTDILGMEHIQARLRASKEAREAAEGMPKGGNRSGGSSQHDVDYWIAKGKLPEDQELAEKVVDAKMKRETQNKFSEEMFVG